MSFRAGIAVLLISLGLLVIGISILGLFRFQDAMQRLHAGALTDTLGLLLILSGVGVLCGLTSHTVKLVLLILILWAVNPVSSHLITRMELITGRDIEPGHMNGEGEQEL